MKQDQTTTSIKTDTAVIPDAYKGIVESILRSMREHPEAYTRTETTGVKKQLKGRSRAALVKIRQSNHPSEQHNDMK
jgi:hypothetical protein